MHVDIRCEDCKQISELVKAAWAPNQGQCVKCGARICKHVAESITSYGNGRCSGSMGCEHRQNVGKR